MEGLSGNGSLIFRNNHVPATEATPWQVYLPMAALYLGTTMTDHRVCHGGASVAGTLLFLNIRLPLADKPSMVWPLLLVHCCS
jgi:hypothetical protein